MTKVLYRYVLFSANREYMSTAPKYDFIKYRAQVNTVTEQFTTLSRQVIDIIKSLRDNAAETVAVLLEKVQVTEKEKLEMVRAAFIILMDKATIGRPSCGHKYSQVTTCLVYQ